MNEVLRKRLEEAVKKGEVHNIEGLDRMINDYNSQGLLSTDGSALNTEDVANLRKELLKDSTIVNDNIVFDTNGLMSFKDPEKSDSVIVDFRQMENSEGAVKGVIDSSKKDLSELAKEAYNNATPEQQNEFLNNPGEAIIDSLSNVKTATEFVPINGIDMNKLDEEQKRKSLLLTSR